MYMNMNLWQKDIIDINVIIIENINMTLGGPEMWTCVRNISI